MAPPKKRDEPPLERLTAKEPDAIGARGFAHELPPIQTTFRTPEGLVLIRGTRSLPFSSVTFEPGPPPEVVTPALAAPATVAAAAPVTSLWQERLKTMAGDAGLSEGEYLEQLLRRAWVMRPIDKKAG